MVIKEKQIPSEENKPSNVGLDINVPPVKSPMTQESLLNRQAAKTAEIAGQAQTAGEGVTDALGGLQGAFQSNVGAERGMALAGQTQFLPEGIQAGLQTGRQEGQKTSQELNQQLGELPFAQRFEDLNFQRESQASGRFRDQRSSDQSGLRELQALESGVLGQQAGAAQDREQAAQKNNLQVINAYYDAIDQQEQRDIDFQKELLSTNKDLFKFYGNQEFSQFQNEMNSEQKALDVKKDDRDIASKLKQELIKNGMPQNDAVLQAQNVEEIYNMPDIQKYYTSTLDRLREAQVGQQMSMAKNKEIRDSAIDTGGFTQNQREDIGKNKAFVNAKLTTGIVAELDKMNKLRKDFYNTPIADRTRRSILIKEMESIAQRAIPAMSLAQDQGALQGEEFDRGLGAMQVPKSINALEEVKLPTSFVGGILGVAPEITIRPNATEVGEAATNATKSALLTYSSAQLEALEFAYPGVTTAAFPDVEYQSALNTKPDDLIKELTEEANKKTLEVSDL